MSCVPHACLWQILQIPGVVFQVHCPGRNGKDVSNVRPRNCSLVHCQSQQPGGIPQGCPAEGRTRWWCQMSCLYVSYVYDRVRGRDSSRVVSRGAIIHMNPLLKRRYTNPGLFTHIYTSIYFYMYICLIRIRENENGWLWTCVHVCVKVYCSTRIYLVQST